MRVIVSHDVDHLRVREHWKDVIIPKMLVRGKYELLRGRIPFGELVRRYTMILHGRMEHIEEVMRFDDRMGVRSCFFFGMANGLGLNYSRERVAPFIQRVLARGFEAGVHGIAFNNEAAMMEEHEAFAAISGLKEFGIRMHYLRQDARTIALVERTGYSFDATSRTFEDSRRVDGIWEFSVHEMDTWAMCGGSRYQARNTSDAVAHTMSRFERAEAMGIGTFNLLFHDVYYTPAFNSWRSWYEQVVRKLAERGCTFTTYTEAMRTSEARIDPM
ncbi:MAG: hypothetical protein IPP83_05720 [Flavobacteriales bacterium]|nr:hypothetical protein [Flavobacteriales bacterium]